VSESYEGWQIVQLVRRGTRDDLDVRRRFLVGLHQPRSGPRSRGRRGPFLGPPADGGATLGRGRPADPVSCAGGCAKASSARSASAFAIPSPRSSTICAAPFPTTPTPALPGSPTSAMADPTPATTSFAGIPALIDLQSPVVGEWTSDLLGPGSLPLGQRPRPLIVRAEPAAASALL
jgi:hypothetical protein